MILNDEFQFDFRVAFYIEALHSAFVPRQVTLETGIPSERVSVGLLFRGYPKRTFGSSADYVRHFCVGRFRIHM